MTSTSDEATERLRQALLTTEEAVPTSGLGRLWRTGRGAAGGGAAARAQGRGGRRGGGGGGGAAAGRAEGDGDEGGADARVRRRLAAGGAAGAAVVAADGGASDGLGAGRGGGAIFDFGCVRSFAPALRRGFADLAAATRADDLEAMKAALVQLGGQAPTKANEVEHVRVLLRGFFGPLLTPGRRRIAADEGLAARGLLSDKRAILGLGLSPRLLFLFRLRFGLYAVLSQLGAEGDWAEAEAQWATMA